MDIKLPQDFKEFLSLLNDHRVDYLLIGGYAVGYHGYPRATGDIDVWIARDPENARRVVAALDAFGFGRTAVSEDLFVAEHSIVRLGNAPMRIEIATSISGVDFATCFANQVIGNLDGIQVPIIGLEDLKANKLASGRLKDLSDLEFLR